MHILPKRILMPLLLTLLCEHLLKPQQEVNMLLFNIKERFVVVYEMKFLLISMFISLAENIEIPLL